MKKIALATTLCSSLVLAACGGSSSSSKTSVASDDINAASYSTLSGNVADGYLQGAKVCLDKNLNDKCDPEEPSTTSKTEGAFDLEINSDDKQKYPVLVEVDADTVDEDTGKPVGKAYVMGSPAMSDGTLFVSPISHMIHHEIKKDGSLTLADAKKIVADKLDMPEGEIEGDFIHRSKTEKDIDKKNRAKELHLQANKIARALAAATDKTKHLTSALSGDEQEEVASLVMSSVDNILPQVLATKVIEKDGALDYSHLDDSIDQLIEGEAKLPENLDELKIALEHEKSKLSSKHTSLESALKEGLFISTMGDEVSANCADKTCFKPASIDIEEIVLDEVTKVITTKQKLFSFADHSLTDVKSEDEDFGMFLLNASGNWVKHTGDECVIKKSDEKESLISCQDDLYQFSVRTNMVDISKRSISSVLAYEFAAIKFKTDHAVFPEGSQLVKMRTKQNSKMIMLPIFPQTDGCNATNISSYGNNCNVVMMSSSEKVGASQLSDVVSPKEQATFNVKLIDGINLALTDDGMVSLQLSLGDEPVESIQSRDSADTSAVDDADIKMVEIENDKINDLVKQVQEDRKTIATEVAIGKWRKVKMQGQEAIHIKLKLQYVNGLKHSYEMPLSDIYLMVQDGFVRTILIHSDGNIEEENGLGLNSKAFDAFIESIQDSVSIVIDGSSTGSVVVEDNDIKDVKVIEEVSSNNT